MIFTEDEAGEKACCKELSHTEDGVRMTPVCLASGCMAWRWGKNVKEKKGIRHPMSSEEIERRWAEDIPPPARPEGVPDHYIFAVYAHDAFWIPTESEHESIRSGYCGLAGRPE